LRKSKLRLVRAFAAQAQFGCLVFIISSWPSLSSGTKPRPPHVGHCCSSSVIFNDTITVAV
jgi:hypothetical protein